MRILITGNMGYLGPVVTEHLRRCFPQAELVGFDTGFFASSLTTRNGLPETVLDAQHFGDIREFPSALLRGVDAVVHLAGLSNDPMGNRFEALTHDINTKASLRVASLAKDSGVSAFVFASSCSVYGFAEDGAARRESDALSPLTAYARSKIATEEGLYALDAGQMTVSCLRFATACGMSPRLRLDLVLNDFVACALTSRNVTVLSDGTPWRPLIEVRDMARAVEWAIGRAPTEGGRVLSVNVGSDTWNYQVKDLAGAVAREISGTQVSINTDAAPDKRSYRVDFSLFGKLAPLHQPEVSLSQAVRGLSEGLQSIGFSDRNFREGEHVRLKALNRLIATGRLDSNLNWARSRVATMATSS